MTEGYDGDCARKERMREDRKKKRNKNSIWK